MDQQAYELIYSKLIEAGFSEDSSAELANHMALHFPEHSRALMGMPPAL